MKILFLAFVFSMIWVTSNGQSPSETLANKIAQKMKDSLSLTETQKSQIYTINIQMHNDKMNVRASYTDHSEITVRLQLIENKRDSLYKSVLPIEKYSLYLQKKRNLINNN